MDKTAVTKMIAGNKCDVTTWNLEDPQMAKIDADTYVLSYKGTFDGTCTTDGKTDKVPSPVRAATVWVRSGDKWQAAFHGENVIVDPKNPPAPPAKPEATKEEPKKDDKAAVNSNTGSNTAAAPAKATGDANTDALVKVELAVWEAWKAKDAKKLEELTTKDILFVDLIGAWTSGQANVVKGWTDMKCEGITKVSYTEGFASALSPTVEILTGKGTADGTCYGQKVGAVYGTSVYVKDGDAWKLAFSMNMPTM
jgi:ketosteroid isomerase-like protein